MTFAFPDGLAPEAYPLAWLVGRWSGTGVPWLCLGTIGNGRIDLATDLMARTPSGADMAATTRLARVSA